MEDAGEGAMDEEAEGVAESLVSEGDGEGPSLQLMSVNFELR